MLAHLGARCALCLRCARALQKVGYFDPFALMAKVTAVNTVFPYTVLLRFLFSPKTQIVN